MVTRKKKNLEIVYTRYNIILLILLDKNILIVKYGY